MTGELVAAVIVLSGATFIVLAQFARRRALGRRGANVTISGGVANIASSPSCGRGQSSR